jgi:hypothetical protein
MCRDSGGLGSDLVTRRGCTGRRKGTQSHTHTNTHGALLLLNLGQTRRTSRRGMYTHMIDANKSMEAESTVTKKRGGGLVVRQPDTSPLLYSYVYKSCEIEQ